MSLINAMLRDLDRRQASAAERAALGSQVRALPPERTFPWLRILPMLAGTAIGATGIWLFLEFRRPEPVEARTAAPEAAPLAPSPMPALVVPMPSDPVDSGDGADMNEAPAAGPKPSADLPSEPPNRMAAAESLQIDFRLSQPPRPRARSAAVGVAQPVIDKRQAAPASDAAEGEYRRAMAAYREGRGAEAFAGFEAALRIDARHVSARQAVLSLLMEQRRWQEAQTVAADGLALDAAQPGWAMVLARLQVEQGQLVEAEQTMAGHAGYGERSPDYQAFHALLLQKLQRPREAAERYFAASSLRPSEGRWWYGLGVALEADQRRLEAQDAFRKAKEAGNLPAELAAAADRRLR